MEDASDDAGGPEKQAPELAGLERRIAMHPETDGICISFPVLWNDSHPPEVTTAETALDRNERDLTTKEKISIEEYLEEVALFCDSEYGKHVRRRFPDVRGTSELAMLAAPTRGELEELRRAVAIMTPSERHAADRLSDEQIEKIAVDARVDPANFAIFMNGYALLCKRVS
jgi:hypothetical protein